MCTELKVMHVIARMNRGGTARYLARLMNSPELQSIDQILVSGEVQGVELEDDCVKDLKVIKIPTLGRALSPLNDFKSYLHLKKIIKEFQPDIIHSHTFKAGLIARFQNKHIKKVHTFHGHLFEDQEFSPAKKSVIKFIERLLSKRSDVLISVGTKVGDELRATGIGINATWDSIPPGVDALRVIEKEIARTQLNIPNDSRVVIGWMARVTGVKNPHLYLEVVKANPDVTFIMAGQGDLSDAIAANKPSNLNIYGWADAAIIWSAVDIAISTSDNEGMPIALIEAQLSGLPVVATDVGSSAEVVLDKQTGIICDKSIAQLSSAITLLANNESLRREYGTAAQARAHKYFDSKIMCEKHLNIYRNLIKKN